MSGRDDAYKFTRTVMVPKKLKYKQRKPKKSMGKRKKRTAKKRDKSIPDLKAKEKKPCVTFKKGFFNVEKCDKKRSVVCKLEGKTCEDH